MDSRITSTRRTRRRAGFLLPETLIGAAITSLVVVVVASFVMFSGRSFAALFNYVDLTDDNRTAIDIMTRDVRQSMGVQRFTTNSLTLVKNGGGIIEYTYNPGSGTMDRIEGGQARTILSGCDSLTFSLGQRNPVGGSYDVFPAATAANAKVINISWVCSRTIFGSKENSESVQTARIVIRKQGS